jgi:hypothetical protein
MTGLVSATIGFGALGIAVLIAVAIIAQSS